MPSLFRLIVLVVALMSAQLAVAGAFSQKPGVCSPGIAAGCYVITGEITQADANAIDRLTAEIIRRKAGTPFFFLDSNGGDMIAAMQIGRALRKTRAVAMMGGANTCLSACVLVLAGATKRWVSGGTIGIHRPYSTNVNIPTYTEAQSVYRQLGELVKRYLQEMNLSESLYEAMVRVPSEQIRILTQNELTEFGLNQKDPVEQEIEDTSDAKRYGLSRQEVLRRKNRASTICSSSMQDEQAAVDYLLCTEQVMRGVR